MRQSSSTAQVSGPVAVPGTEHRGLRDLDRWKDKIEIRLDNRQVAFLFFGSALIACLLFILGVVVGKRLESRGHALAPDIEDPLALLDRVASTVPPSQPTRSFGEVAISRAYASGSARSGRPARTERLETERKVAAAVVAETDEFAARPEARPEGRPEPKAAKKTVDVVPPAVGNDLPTKVAPPLPKPVAKVAAPPPTNAEILPPSGMGKPGAPPSATPPARPVNAALPSGSPGGLVALNAAGPTTGTKPAIAGRPRFMLQVGSFAQRAEAEAFASGFAAERPMVVTSELPGKGTWFRVRVGGFANFKEAVDAKLAFERRYNKIALVIGPL